MTRYLDELQCGTPLSRNSPNRKDVIKVQDWLRLNGFSVGASGSDGDFGGNTDQAVKAYQRAHNLEETGVVDPALWARLVEPLKRAMGFQPAARNFGDAVVEVAGAHLAEHPVELDANRDGWVRTYCRGSDGEPFAWCQGFASTIWDQASEFTGVAPPIDLMIFDEDAQRKLWCLFVPTMVNQAKKQGRFLSSEQAQAAPGRITKGSMFYVKGGEFGYRHVGLVTDVRGGNIITCEGNTNAAGSSNGFEVAARVRTIAGNDFGLC